MALRLLDRPDLAETLWNGMRGAIETGSNAISRAHLGAAIDRIGHTSGWDALAGAKITLRAYTKGR